MTLTSPIPFRQALQQLAGRKAMPTLLDSADLAGIDGEILDKAFFSARNFYEDVLNEFKSGISDLLNPRTETRLVDGVATPFTAGINPAELRTRVKELYDQIGYEPFPDEAGTIEDHASDARINLVIYMNTRDAAGYGQFARNQSPALLFSHPCMELVRFEDRKEKRAWIERWRGAGGKVFAGKPEGLPLSEETVQEQGRLIARKDDQVWFNISAFHRPWPPFDFNSGVGVRPVRRKEAIALGVINAGDQVGALKVPFKQEELAA
jgi:hypothetical protein